MAIDRVQIREMVEEFWRSFLAIGRSNPALAKQSIYSFEKRINDMAGLMTGTESKFFLSAIDEEREILFNEYMKNPTALKHRLGLIEDNNKIYQQLNIDNQDRREGIAGMVVRTALAAAITKIVVSFFSIFK